MLLASAGLTVAAAVDVGPGGSGVSSSGGGGPVPALLPSPDLECQLELTGDCTQATCLGSSPSWSVQSASLRCSSFFSTGTTVAVTAGRRFSSAISNTGANSSSSSSTAVDGSEQQWNATLAFSERSSGADDWGLTFSGLRHLRLVDSVIRGVPLSSVGPLLQCQDCTAVSVANLTVQSVYGSVNAADPTAEPPRTGLWGVLHATAVQQAHLSGFRCVDVTGATGWSCLRLQLAASSSSSSGSGSSSGSSSGSGSSWAGAEVWLEDSVLANSSVVWRSSEPSYGAVGLTAHTGAPAVRLSLLNSRVDNHTSRGPDCQAAGIAVVAPLSLVSSHHIACLAAVATIGYRTRVVLGWRGGGREGTRRGVRQGKSTHPGTHGQARCGGARRVRWAAAAQGICKAWVDPGGNAVRYRATRA